VDESFARLHAADWSVDDVRLLTAAGALWQVDASDGRHTISARASSQAEAWQDACRQAEALGILGWSAAAFSGHSRPGAARAAGPRVE
jgi:hypothetical protein